MNILNTLLGGVTTGVPLAGDIAKMTIIEATVNNQDELTAIVQTAKDIQKANEIMGDEAPGIRLALAPSAEITSEKIRGALEKSGVPGNLFHVKDGPQAGDSFSFDEYVAASENALAHFNTKHSNVNLRYINAPNIAGLTEEMLQATRAGTEGLRNFLAENLLAWLRIGDRWFTIESFNTMFEAAILAAQSA